MRLECLIGALLCFGCITSRVPSPNVAAAAPVSVAPDASAPAPQRSASSAPLGAPRSGAVDVPCGARIEAVPVKPQARPSMDRWLPAIENYTPCVSLGKQAAIGTAAADFARYLTLIHNRVHPVFAGSYLRFLDGLQGDARLNGDLKVSLEVVISGKDGSIASLGVITSSGVTAFDVLALESVSRAAPFGAPLPAILSSDGNVYVHWELHRNPLFACSSYFMRPYLLQAASPLRAPPAARAPSLQ